ncbi:nucleotidyl transferase AbiEii/AbiGii toxin family protein [Hydrocarboniphaga sp.]|uniref:nucleotidyl transferase AbiEii/AbiGii toxin family protein n=1 Tax=Hydrocarboniphaga sp. TaxID=2033016 RepID=UPI00262800D3|nr:nucleotidyl transferase AbiEii/AbiGii toxin family protein [Hydrocarboniphaga sp.]
MHSLPEVAAFPCIDPIETAADKLSALAWRVCTRQRGSNKDDPTIVRHLHDLAALENRVAASPLFKMLLQQVAAADTSRGGRLAPEVPAERFAAMLDHLQSDPLWAKEYEQYVQLVSFAGPGERITFGKALGAASRLAAIGEQ